MKTYWWNYSQSYVALREIRSTVPFLVSHSLLAEELKSERQKINTIYPTSDVNERALGAYLGVSQTGYACTYVLIPLALEAYITE
jgi:hypothetical protein